MKRLRKFGIWLSITLLGWNSDHILWPAVLSDSFPARLRCGFGWWLEGAFCRLFDWSYIGSEEEIEDGIEAARDDVPLKYMTPIQREVRTRLCEWEDVE